MSNLEWCKQQKHGIKKVEPSDNVAEDYIDNAEESLRILKEIKDTKSKIWIATTKYYIEYFAFYAVMMRIGVKSEIHDCTIEVADWLEDRGVVDEETVKELERSKELRIENQYYLKNKSVEVDIDQLRDFILRMKKIKDQLTRDRLNALRSELFS